MTIAFIEGLPAGGKTHLIKYIESKGYRIIDELGRVLKPDEFPGDGKTIDEILRIHDWFIDKEHVRFEKAPEGIFERSFMTQLGYAFAYPRYMNLNSFEKGVDKYADAISSDWLPLPDLLFYVSISVEDSIKRQRYRYLNKEQAALPELWTTESFLNDLVRADNALISSMSGITVVKVDGNLTTEQKYKQVEHYLMNMDAYASANKNIDIDRFLQELK